MILTSELYFIFVTVLRIVAKKINQPSVSFRQPLMIGSQTRSLSGKSMHSNQPTTKQEPSRMNHRSQHFSLNTGKSIYEKCGVLLRAL